MRIVSLRTTVLGIISWLAPFVFSFLFVDRTGQFVVPQPLFKSLMVVVFGGFGAWLLVVACRNIAPSTRSGFALGCYWLAINLALDLVVLLPLTGMTVTGYVYDIGLRYLLIPIIATAMGAVAQRAKTDGRERLAATR